MLEFLSAVFYPAFLVCFFFGLIILVGTVFSYWWLVVFDKRMRTCARCGKVGGGQLAESFVVHLENYMDFKRTPPSRITVKTHEDHYECDQCGHTWTRTAKETNRVTVKN
jgi:hypothetical protein